MTLLPFHSRLRDRFCLPLISTVAYYSGAFVWSNGMNDVIYRESLRTVDSQERSPMLLSAAYYAAQYSWVDNDTYPAVFDQAYFHTLNPNQYLDIVSDYAFEYLEKVSEVEIHLTLLVHKRGSPIPGRGAPS